MSRKEALVKASFLVTVRRNKFPKTIHLSVRTTVKFMWFFRILNTNIEELSLIAFFIIVFMKSSLNLEVSFIHSKLFGVGFYDICYSFPSQYSSYDHCLFLSWSFIKLLLDFAFRWIAWHIPPVMHFSTINVRSISVNICHFISVFCKAACHGNWDAKEFCRI